MQDTYRREFTILYRNNSEYCPFADTHNGRYMASPITFCTVLLLTSLYMPPVRSVFFFTKKKLDYNKSESYTIVYDSLDIQDATPGRYPRPPNIGEYLSSYRNISSTYNTDERCENGQPLSMGVLPYAPYVYDTFGMKRVTRFFIVNG